jgi:arginyl-tRNA synthetase
VFLHLKPTILRVSIIGARLAQAGTARNILQEHASSRFMCMSSSAIGTRQILSERVKSALNTAFGADALGADAMVLPAKPEHGDYQCNAAMPLAKKLKLKPRDIAEKLVQTLQVEDVVATMDISGPGFINIHLADSFVKNKLIRMLRDPTRLGIAPVENKQRIIVDFSSPNIAKEMHVGHLRSTIIGDSLSRVLEFLGHDVLRLNHVGDWGTQFGMLIRFLYENHPGAITESADADGSASIGVDIGDLVMFYKAAKKRFDEDPVFQEASRAEVVRLQSGDKATLRAWKAICDLSRGEFQKIYDMLDVQINERGESFYNLLLPSLVEELEKSGAAVVSDGAKCIFLPGYTNPDGTPQPMIVKKSDGGFLYATTDLAAVRQRSREENADRILYGKRTWSNTVLNDYISPALA